MITAVIIGLAIVVAVAFLVSAINYDSSGSVNTISSRDSHGNTNVITSGPYRSTIVSTNGHSFSGSNCTFRNIGNSGTTNGVINSDAGSIVVNGSKGYVEINGRRMLLKGKTKSIVIDGDRIIINGEEIQ